MKIKNLPSVIKKRAKINIKKEWRCGHKPKIIMNAFDWSDTTEGYDYWILVYEGKFIEAENLLLERLKEEYPLAYKITQLIEDNCWTGTSTDSCKDTPFFLDEALDVKVNEPEVVSYKDEMLVEEDYLKKIDLGWNTFIPTSNVHTGASKLGSSAVSIINDSFKKAIEIKRDRIVEGVIEKFRSRSEVGIKKYGTTLDRDDLSLEQWLDHAIEEQMDSILYLTKIKEEIKNKNNEKN
jgi:hypothetical protein